MDGGHYLVTQSTAHAVSEIDPLPKRGELIAKQHLLTIITVPGPSLRILRDGNFPSCHPLSSQLQNQDTAVAPSILAPVRDREARYQVLGQGRDRDKN